MRGICLAPSCGGRPSPTLESNHRQLSAVVELSRRRLPRDLKKPRALLEVEGFHFRRRAGELVCCRSSQTTPGPSSGENESKAVLDAFFLGKAFAEALNERVGSTIGEILSVVGQWQAEQQKQVQDFQEEVLERAKRAKEKAALEVMEEQGVIPKSSTVPPDATINASPPSPGPTPGDSLQVMFKD